MRRAALAAAAILSGCGYAGDPLPPALKRPSVITDLTAVERGAKIVVQFTIPTMTTEDLPVDGTPELELRIGPPPGGPFQFPAWEKGSERVAKIDVSHPVARAEIEVGPNIGKAVILGVRAHGPGGRTAGWSNLIPLDVVPPLATPGALVAKNSPDAVALEWRGAAPRYRVFRRVAEAAPAPAAQIAVADKANYVDAEIEYGKTYEYSVQAMEKTRNTPAESDTSAVISFQPKDTFPPAVPTGLTPVPGTRSIELVWERNAEKDFGSYRVYRNEMKLADALLAPSFSDRDVKSGVKYSYRVSAVDTTGNESARSAPVEAALP